MCAGLRIGAQAMPQTLPADENAPPSKMAEASERDALRQRLEERDKARAALVEVVQEEDQRIAQLREKRAQDREMRRKEHEAAQTQPPPAQPPKPRRRRRKPVSDVEDARRQEKERTAAEEAEKAPPPDPRDAERRELWKELGAYGDSLRERVDFPENYDEVVQLMSRNDLNNKEETWSEAALAGGDFSKYANLFADDENDKKLRAGLATIERLDRELAKVHAKARAVRDMGQLPPPPVQRPSSADSTSTNRTGPFITQKRLHKRVQPRDDVSAMSDASVVQGTDFVLNNKVQGGDKSLLTIEQQDRAYQLELGEDENDEVLRGLSEYVVDDERLREIDAELAALGRETDEVLRDAEARAAAVAASAKEGEVGASDHEKARNFLQLAREARALKARQSDVDAQLAEVRARPLVLAEDEDSEGVKASDVKRLVEEYRDAPPVPRERLDDLLKSLRATEAPSQLALALKDAEMIRDERRRVDERATPRRDYQTFGDEIHAVMERRSEENPFARDDDRLEDALLEASLRAEQALRNSDAVLARSSVAE